MMNFKLIFSVFILAGCSHPFEKDYVGLGLGSITYEIPHILHTAIGRVEDKNSDLNSINNPHATYYCKNPKPDVNIPESQADGYEQALIQTAINECERSIRQDFYVEDIIDGLSQAVGTILSFAGSPTTILDKLITPIFSSFGVNSNTKPSSSVLSDTDRETMGKAATQFISTNYLLKRNSAYYASLYNATLAACPNKSNILFPPKHENLNRLRNVTIEKSNGKEITRDEPTNLVNSVEDCTELTKEATKNTK